MIRLAESDNAAIDNKKTITIEIKRLRLRIVFSSFLPAICESPLYYHNEGLSTISNKNIYHWNFKSRKEFQLAECHQIEGVSTYMLVAATTDAAFRLICGSIEGGSSSPFAAFITLGARAKSAATLSSSK